MGYMHIDNLYRAQEILSFKTCYALEKIHGTSANVSWKDGKVWFSSGGEKRERFVTLFDESALIARFAERFLPEDHVVGKASIVWFSKSPYKGVRWDRIFKFIK